MKSYFENTKNLQLRILPIIQKKSIKYDDSFIAEKIHNDILWPFNFHHHQKL